MKFAVSRLERTNGRKSLEVVIDSGMNDAFEDLGYEIEVGYRTVTGKVVDG